MPLQTIYYFSQKGTRALHIFTLDFHSYYTIKLIQFLSGSSSLDYNFVIQLASNRAIYIYSQHYQYKSHNILFFATFTLV